MPHWTVLLGDRARLCLFSGLDIQMYEGKIKIEKKHRRNEMADPDFLTVCRRIGTAYPLMTL